MELMYSAELDDDQFPTKWSVKTGMPSNGAYFIQNYHEVWLNGAADQFSVGAFADSAHEYLLKQYLLTGMSEPKVLDLCK